MFPFTYDYSSRQRNFSRGTNTCEYIVVHHTATWKKTAPWVVKTLLWETVRKVSCHFLIDEEGNTYKLGDPKQILWHAWESQWEGKKGMNAYSLGIELIWPLPWFTDPQRFALKKLVEHLMWVFNLDYTKVIRHRDISAGRKIDPDNSLWNHAFGTWEDYRKRFKQNAV